MSEDSKLIDYFLNAQFAEFKASNNTILAYSRDLNELKSFVRKKMRSLKEVKRIDIDNFMINLSNNGMAPATRARKLSSIKSFYRFLNEEKICRGNPSIKIRQPKLSKKLPKILTEEDVEKMLHIAKTMGKTKAERIRNHCLMELLYATGMRVSEILSLPASVVSSEKEMLYIIGKGGKERLVPLSVDSQICLKKWLVEWNKLAENQKQEQGKEITYLFPSNSKKGHLSRIWFYKLIKAIASKANLNSKEISPHTLRHAFATHLLANGADLRVIQTFLGHSDISSTEIYTHVLTHRLRDLLENYHPLATST